MARAIHDGWRARAVGLCVSAACVVGLLVPEQVHAQSISDDVAGELQRLRERAPAVATSPLDQARERARVSPGRVDLASPTGLPLDPEALRALERLQASRIEVDYSERTGEDLDQFGYDIFASGTPAQAAPSGALQDSYVLGIGDELVITFRGQTNETVVTRVDREGRVVLPQLPPVPAAGRSFLDFREDLKERTEMTLLGTEVFVSVGSIRSVRVMVVGEVEKPGFQQLTALSTVLDALAMAGGIKKTGSLRRIQIVRAGEVFPLDLYQLMFSGRGAENLTVAEGDRIIVPTIGATLAVAGWVKRPGIYELAAGQKAVSLREAVGYGGGPLRPAGNRYLHVTPDESGRDEVRESTDLAANKARDGDILLVARSENVQIGDVTLDGHLRVPQRRSLAAAPTLKRLIGDGSTIEADPYLLFAAVQTTDERTRTRRFYPINLGNVLAGEQDFELRDQDVVVVLSLDDVHYLGSDDVQSILSGGRVARDRLERCRGLFTLAEVLGRARPGRFSAALQEFRSSVGAVRSEPADETVEARQVALEERRADLDELLTSVAAQAITPDELREALRPEEEVPTCPEIYDEYPDLLPFVLEHVAAVQGEVRRPGAYPVVAGTSLQSLVTTAGGAAREIDLTAVEVTRYLLEPEKGEASTERQLLNVAASGMAGLVLNAGDVVRLNAVFSDRDVGPVQLTGEFKRPGSYAIRRGERLSEVVARAGGLTAQAYPYGAVFTRESAKRQEQQGFERAARELESSVTAAVTRRDSESRDIGGALQAVSQLVGTLRSIEPVGRVVVEADPTVLQIRPELDLVLEPGDRLIMPKRPNSVTVSGEVLNPGAMQFRSGLGPEDYVDKAGGMREDADDDRVFVVYPNGEAQPLSFSFWNYEPVQVPPGSTIVVPRDPNPFDLALFAKDMTQILSQVAITAASIAVISNN